MIANGAVGEARARGDVAVSSGGGSDTRGSSRAAKECGMMDAAWARGREDPMASVHLLTLLTSLPVLTFSCVKSDTAIISNVVRAAWVAKCMAFGMEALLYRRPHLVLQRTWSTTRNYLRLPRISIGI